MITRPVRTEARESPNLAGNHANCAALSTGHSPAVITAPPGQRRNQPVREIYTDPSSTLFKYRAYSVQVRMGGLVDLNNVGMRDIIKPPSSLIVTFLESLDRQIRSPPARPEPFTSLH